MLLKAAGVAALVMLSSVPSTSSMTAPASLLGDVTVKIVCRDALGGATGTGTRVGPNMVLTAAHVSNGRLCTINGEPVHQVEASTDLDFALLRTNTAQRWMPISCRPIAFGNHYTAWGFAMGGPLYGQSVFGTITHPLTIIQHPGFGKTGVFVGFERFIPGMSGGAILDRFGNLVGIVIGFHPIVPASYGRMISDTHLCGSND